MFGWVYEIHAANRFLSETTRWSMPLSWGKVLDARMNLLVFSMFDVVTPLLMWFMTTFATALLPRLFSGTRELERVPPACCNLRSANVSPHQPKPANPAGREIVVLSLKFLRVAILFILSHKWRRLVGWLLPSQAHDCSNNLLCEQLPKRSQWWGSYLTKSLMICKMRLLEIWQSHWMESLWKKFTFCWELAIHGHTGNEICVQKAESPVPWCLKRLHQDAVSPVSTTLKVHLGVRCWRTGWQQSSSSSLADSVPKGCLTWSFHWGCEVTWYQLPRLTQVVLEPKEPGQIDGVFGCWRCSEMVGVIQRHRPFPLFSPVFGRLYSDPGNIHNFKESNFISVRLRRIEQRQEGWQERRVIRKNHNGTILVILSPIRFLHVEFHVLPWPGNLANSLISWPAWRVGFQAGFDCKA